tara:strand:- start:489 stop:1418 length:930 start_codon:yes stop_codon:yes gene_type:complete
MKRNIFIATSTFAEFDLKPINELTKNDFTFSLNKLKRKLTEDELIKYGKDSFGIIAGTENYSRSVIKELDNLKIISRLGVGIDNIDLDAVNEKNIKILTTKTTPALSVAELVLGLIIDLSRHITYHDKNMRKEIWNKKMGSLVKGKTLGIVGLGNIGKELINLSKGFNFNLLAFDIKRDLIFCKKNDVKYCSLDHLLSHSDIVSIHLNLSDDTRKIINKKNIQLMKKDAIIINTSRGEVIDEDSLYEALYKNRILGAGLDVFDKEPYSGKLCNLNNVVLTPHIGSYSKEIRIDMETEAVNNILEEANYV